MGNPASMQPQMNYRRLRVNHTLARLLLSTSLRQKANCGVQRDTATGGRRAINEVIFLGSGKKQTVLPGKTAPHITAFLLTILQSGAPYPCLKLRSRERCNPTRQRGARRLPSFFYSLADELARTPAALIFFPFARFVCRVAPYETCQYSIL